MKSCVKRFLVILSGIIAMLGIATFTSSTAQAAATKVSPISTVTTTTMYSKKLHLDWNYDVYLPGGYNPSSSKKYPVVYMMHGLYGNHRNLLERFNSQQMLDGAMKRNNQKAIVVFIDGFNSFYVNQKGGMQMESAIMKDLIPKINSTYKVSSSRSDHAIGGISMGGYAAARLSLKYSKYFSKALLISPSVWYSLPKDNPIRMNMHAFTNGKTNWSDKVYDSLFPTKYINKDTKPVKFYVETTSDDTTVPIKNVNRFVKTLKKDKYSVKYVKDTGDNHNWTYWTKATPKSYNWLMKEFK
ncbi:alpha/beta hydrolase-fold protein [Companilactobacillus paralimentarius]|jgi:Predicted esterase|uniref:alpha/beta hydrolase n=1 Tax=Companilactobacillus paralimentarius TaxID=83526 RepID=UPI002853716F|nr:alpha/beta hydrolase-fold protein [Companilactobacillus paralimentarius]MDR4932893.1 alpha/beta hydrolase-fold protein [Companilactobacillus paralimentarius]